LARVRLLSLEREQGKYQKLIIDIRDNGGGTPEYVYESLLCPFLDGPVTFRQVAGLRKKYLQDTKQSVLQDLKKQYALYVIETRELKPPNGFAENDWVFYEITRQIRPSQRYSFQGKIYVLINGGCWSAADDYADLVKRTGLGTLAGQNTGGGGGHEDGPDQQQDQERLTRLADDRWPHTDAVPPPRPGFAVFPSDRVRVVSA
jgi:C-terminal processing protease CtpA/Prc